MREKEYQDFSLQLHDKGARRPLVGQFELTHRCNLRCQHCYIVRNTKKAELAYEEICRIINEVHEEGCLWLCLTGGEPLLREDFLDIYSYVYKKGFIITIFTNAALLHEKIAKYLSRFPPFCIEVTLNGVTKKTYELITQVEGSFEKAMQGIELIRKYRLPFKLKCQAMTLNVNELPRMRRFYKKMDLGFRCGTLIDPCMDGSTEPCCFRLPIDKIAELRNQNEAANGRDEVEDNFLGNRVSSDNLFLCPGGKEAFYVSPYGELFFCNSVRKPSLDLRKHPLSRDFMGSFRRFFRNNLKQTLLAENVL